MEEHSGLKDAGESYRQLGGVRPADRVKGLMRELAQPLQGLVWRVGAGTDGAVDCGVRGGLRELRESCG